MVSESVLDALPEVEPIPGAEQLAIDDDGLCAPLSEKEISVAMSQLKNGWAPGLDEVRLRSSSLEVFFLFSG